MSMKKWGSRLWLPGICALALFAAIYEQHIGLGGNALYALSLPFLWIGSGLRTLSLLGTAGNILSWALYLILGLAPAGVLLLLRWRKKRPFRRADVLLLLLSACGLFILYYFINPQLIRLLFSPLLQSFSQEMLPLWQSILPGVYWSILAAYAALRFVDGEAKKAFARLDLLLCVLAGALAVGLFYGEVSTLLSSFPAKADTPYGSFVEFSGPAHIKDAVLREIGYAPGAAGADGFLAVLRFILEALPLLLLYRVIPAARRLIGSLKAASPAPENAVLCGEMARRAKASAIAAALCPMAYNLIQLLLARNINNVTIAVSLPLFSLLLSIAALLLARGLQESWRLYDENRQFV